MDDECPDYAACRNRQCINPCAILDPCAPLATCQVVNHQPVCTCPDGFIGSPQTECRPREFLRITPHLLWQNEDTAGNTHYFLAAPQPECVTSPECPLHLACIQQQCQDPCTAHACGVNAECSVKNHIPLCTCLRGYEGDPKRICEEPGCKSDYECADDKACISKECQNPCLFADCGTNAYCEPRNHKADCLCLENHIGDPFSYCRPYECLVDDDCPTTLACRQEKCVDPCECAINAGCNPRNHRGYCTCHTGYTGDPYGVACTKSKTSHMIS